jgi:hypothetical protein
MPIYLNLLAEAQAAEDLRRRDPVKRVAFAGMLIVAGMLVWYSGLLLKVMKANRELSQAQFQIDSHANAYQEGVTNSAKIAITQTKIDGLGNLVNARMLQGNLLNALQKINVDNVQLTGIKVDQAYVLNSKPASATEKIVVTLNARDSSANPGDQVGKFRDALSKESYFRQMLDKTNGIRLADESAPQQDGSGKSFVSFTLECHFPDHKR